MAGEGHNRIRAAARDVVLVDGHAHNLVDLSSSFAFEHAFVEAGDDVLRDVPHTISFKRSVKDVAGLYELEEDSFEGIHKHRQVVGLKALSTKCFEAAKIGTLLLDDGLTFDKMKDISWHREILPNVHRILRIEKVAQDLVNSKPPHGLAHWNYKALEEELIKTLESLSSSVVGFKSIAAYRSGLGIDIDVTDQDAELGLSQDIKLAESKNNTVVRLQNKDLIDRLFLTALGVATSKGLPVQIHTGFGDKDLDLRNANPLHLRSVLDDKRFSKSRLVLLHASYPFMREATYLASVYPQVYLDFGLAIPKLSVRGMRAAVAELLELAPLNKVMFSTDGYAFPETFFLGAKWSRTVLANVLCEAYDDGDLSVDECVEAAEALLRNNSVAFYKLKEESSPSPSSLHKKQPKPVAAPRRGEEVAAAATAAQDVEDKSSEKSVESDEDWGGVNSFCEPLWLENVKYVTLLFGDYSGQRRSRVVPAARYKSSVAATGVGLAKCVMGMLSYSDHIAEGSGLTSVGETKLIPDATTGHKLPTAGHGLVLVDMHESPGVPWELCPRGTLRRLLHVLDKEFGLTLKAGFELEFYLMRKVGGSAGYEVVDDTRYCSTAGLNQSLPVIESMLTWLDSLAIETEQFHAEAGGGQLEIALAYTEATKSADNLLLAREAIKTASMGHQLTATFFPKPGVPGADFGSGCHCHLSLWKDGKNVTGASSPSDSNYGVSETGNHFFAGVLHHLPAVLALIAPHPASYERIQPNTWSGAFHCWGHENKEAPLRAVGSTTGAVSNFELKSFDGVANPHLGLAAIVAAGLDGLRKKLKLPTPIDVNPADLEKGRLVRLPANLEEATANLENDTPLKELLGEKVVKTVVAIRKADAEHYGGALPLPSSTSNKYLGVLEYL